MLQSPVNPCRSISIFNQFMKIFSGKDMKNKFSYLCQLNSLELWNALYSCKVLISVQNIWFYGAALWKDGLSCTPLLRHCSFLQYIWKLPHSTLPYKKDCICGQYAHGTYIIDVESSEGVKICPSLLVQSVFCGAESVFCGAESVFCGAGSVAILVFNHHNHSKPHRRLEKLSQLVNRSGVIRISNFDNCDHRLVFLYHLV